jgi:predicted phage-related endonuclease
VALGVTGKRTTGTRGDRMSAFDKDKPKIDLPLDVAAWIELYRKTQGEIKSLEEKLDQAKAKIQEMMGENEVGMLDGRVAVRWTKVTSFRLDVAKAKEVLDPKIYTFLSRESESRRFTIVEPDVNN